MFEQARLTAELFFWIRDCPQGRLKVLTWHDRPVTRTRNAGESILMTHGLDPRKSTLA
ncbi:hypothetical protein DOCECA_06620 [Pseudomonas sp. E102]